MFKNLNKIGNSNLDLTSVLSIVAICILSLLLVSFSLNLTRFGFDFTDEGLYLNSITNPFLYDWSLSQFGFFYHPIFLFLNSDIVLLRKFNFIFVYLLTFILGLVFLDSFKLHLTKFKKENIFLSLGLSSLSIWVLIPSSSWLPSPSYNSLALQGLIIFSIGFLLSFKDNYRKGWPWIVIGIGGWILFIAKPSSAMILCFLFACHFLILGKVPLRGICISLLTVLVFFLFSAYLIDLSITKYVNRIIDSVTFPAYQEGGYSFFEILRLDKFSFNTEEKILFLIISLFSFIHFYKVFSSNKLLKYTNIFLVFVYFLLSLLCILGILDVKKNYGDFVGVVTLSFFFASFVFWLVFIRSKISRKFIAASFLFLFLPHVYAFGSNSNYWQGAMSASIFWILSGFFFLTPLADRLKGWLFIAPLVLLGTAMSVFFLKNGVNSPYRQPVFQENYFVEAKFSQNLKNVFLSQEYAFYIDNAFYDAYSAGFKKDTPLLDLTGLSPGLLFSLQAKSIGQPWMIGGYSGSYRLAYESIKKVSCDDLATSWILTEPDGPRSISSTLLESFGASLLRDYSYVISWVTPAYAAGATFSRTQILYRPNNKKFIYHNCALKRKNK
jgi:hypothetical protein